MVIAVRCFGFGGAGVSACLVAWEHDHRAGGNEGLAKIPPLRAGGNACPTSLCQRPPVYKRLRCFGGAGVFACPRILYFGKSLGNACTTKAKGGVERA